MPTAKYTDIYNELKRRIESGKYKFQDMLPSEFRLVQIFDCSRNTVRRAISLLSEEGYVQSIHGKGVQVIYLPRLQEEFPFNDVNMIRKLGRGELEGFRWKLLKFTEVISDSSCPKDVFPRGTMLYYAERQYFKYQAAVYTDAFYIRREMVPKLTAQEMEYSFVDYLDRTLVQRMITTKRRFSLQRATAYDERHLDLQGFNCVVVSDSYSFNIDGELFVYIHSRYSPSWYSRYEQLRW